MCHFKTKNIEINRVNEVKKLYEMIGFAIKTMKLICIHIFCNMIATLTTMVTCYFYIIINKSIKSNHTQNYVYFYPLLKSKINFYIQ